MFIIVMDWCSGGNRTGIAWLPGLFLVLGPTSRFEDFCLMNLNGDFFFFIGDELNLGLFGGEEGFKGGDESFEG